MRAHLPEGSVRVSLGADQKTLARIGEGLTAIPVVRIGRRRSKQRAERVVALCVSRVCNVYGEFGKLNRAETFHSPRNAIVPRRLVVLSVCARSQGLLLLAAREDGMEDGAPQNGDIPGGVDGIGTLEQAEVLELVEDLAGLECHD